MLKFQDISEILVAVNHEENRGFHGFHFAISVLGGLIQALEALPEAFDLFSQWQAR